MIEKKITWKINIGMLISYIVSLGLFIFLFIVFSSLFFMIAGVIWLVLMMASLVEAGILSRKVKVVLEMGEGEKKRGEVVPVRVCVDNPTWCMSLFSRMTLGIENVFAGDKVSWEVMMPVRPHKMNEMVINVRVNDLGTYHFVSEDFQMRDLFGVVRYHILVQTEGKFHCFPDMEKEKEIDVNMYMNGLAEIDESSRKGHDFAEVSDIREYQPGDKLRDIHWKLSAKSNELMVKERISMAGSEMVVVVEFLDSYERTQRIIEVTDMLGNSFFRQRVPIRLLLWNQKKQYFEEFHLVDRMEWLNAWCEIFSSAYTDYITTDMHRKIGSIYERLEKYICVSGQDNEIIVELRENG